MEAEKARVVLEDGRASGATVIGSGDPAPSVQDSLGVDASGNDMHDSFVASADGDGNNFGIRAHPALRLPQVGTEHFDRVIETEGYCAMEVFCGCMAITMHMMFAWAPTCRLWDVKYGEQVDIL